MKILISSSQPIVSPLFHINHQPKTLKTLIPKATSSQTPNPIKPSSLSKNQAPKPHAKGFSGVRTANESPAPPKQSGVYENDSDSNKNDSSSSSDDTVPQIVFERMLVRIVVTVGIPMGAGLLSMKFFGEVRGYWNIPIWVQLLTLLFTFGMSSVGLAYGALSSSWDADNKGSLLGFEEAKKNWGDMWREEDEYNNNNNNKNKLEKNNNIDV